MSEISPTPMKMSSGLPSVKGASSSTSVMYFVVKYSEECLRLLPMSWNSTISRRYNAICVASCDRNWYTLAAARARFDSLILEAAASDVSVKRLLSLRGGSGKSPEIFCDMRLLPVIGGASEEASPPSSRGGLSTKDPHKDSAAWRASLMAHRRLPRPV